MVSKIRMLLLAAAVMATFSVAIPATVSAGDCCEPVCCAPPPPVEVELCVVDPCTGCPYKVCVCVPACCACEVPCLADCRNGLFGRKILTYKYSCGHCVEVVITKHRGAIAR